MRDRGDYEDGYVFDKPDLAAKRGIVMFCSRSGYLGVEGCRQGTWTVRGVRMGGWNIHPIADLNEERRLAREDNSGKF